MLEGIGQVAVKIYLKIEKTGWGLKQGFFFFPVNASPQLLHTKAFPSKKWMAPKGEQSLLFLLEIAGWPRWGLGFVLIPEGYLASEESVVQLRPEG